LENRLAADFDDEFDRPHLSDINGSRAFVRGAWRGATIGFSVSVLDTAAYYVIEDGVLKLRSSEFSVSHEQDAAVREFDTDF
jgi:hypothetical protein